MIITFTIFGIFIVLISAGKINLYFHFSKAVNSLFAQSKYISGKKFSYSQLIGLPQPVQRYFRHVLQEGQPYISYARITHRGQFKTGLNKAWVNIKGEQYFTIEQPGFIWKGTTNLFTARDMYIAGAGRLIVSLFSIFNILDGKGEKYNQGELLRWLAENVWFPTNLLPNEKLAWSAIDAYKASLTFKHKGLSINYTVTINETGEIVGLETKRYMGDGKLETWVGTLNSYKELNGIKVPTNIEVAWILEKGRFSYANFMVENIEYDIPKLF